MSSPLLGQTAREQRSGLAGRAAPLSPPGSHWWQRLGRQELAFLQQDPSKTNSQEPGSLCQARGSV